MIPDTPPAAMQCPMAGISSFPYTVGIIPMKATAHVGRAHQQFRSGSGRDIFKSGSPMNAMVD
jgi:hypothetical protein